jgi:hypothetical protein
LEGEKLMKCKLTVRVQFSGHRLEYGLLYECPLDADPKGKVWAQLALTNRIGFRVTGADQKFEVGFYSGDHLSIGCCEAYKMWNISSFRPEFEALMISFSEPFMMYKLIIILIRYQNH